MHLKQLQHRLFAPIDIASIVVFRAMFGAIMLWEVYRYVDGQWIHRYYIEPTFHFKYFGFGWVEPWPDAGMYIHFAVLGVLAAFITLGFLYRLSATLFFIAFTYVFLLDQTRHLNHFYLVCLISFLLIFVPAHRAYSLDAWLRPRIHSKTVPAWSLWLLRAQIGIVYFYGGIAKLNPDWLRGEPLSTWLPRRRDDSILGSFISQDWAGMLFSYGGLLLDLLVVPFLLWRRTRLAALVLVIGFHLINARVFSIGIFPWFMIGATLLFLSPGWPRRVGLLPARGESEQETFQASPPLASRQRITMALLGIYLAVQLLVPLRHFLYPGTVHWTEEGHRFSWHMKLRGKSGQVRFRAKDPATGELWIVDLRHDLTPKQVRKMSGRPDMILQFAHFLADRLRRQGHAQIEIYGDAKISLNGRRPAFLIDPQVDLAAQPRSLLPAAWIRPLTEPLR